MPLLLLSVLFGPTLNAVTLLGWLVNVFFLLAFFVVAHQVYSPANKKMYEKESMIPLEDDSPAEKQIFRHEDNRNRHSSHLDA